MSPSHQRDDDSVDDRQFDPALNTPFASATTPGVGPVPSSPPAPPEGPADVSTLDGYIADPAVFEEHREPTHATTAVPYDSAAAALAADERYAPMTDRLARSDHVRLLDGEWDFQFYERPADVPDSYAEEAWDTIPVPGVWQTEGYDQTIYANNTITWDEYDPPLEGELDPREGISIPDTNPTGVYRRSFSVPEAWGGRELFVHFGGVKQAYFVWIDGTYVGFQQGSNTPGEFDVTDHVEPGGEHELTVRVHRFSDGEALETIDMFRYAGIFRSVYLVATPQAHVRDWFVRTGLDDDYEDGRVRIDAELTDYGGAPDGPYELRASLYEPDADPETSAPLETLSSDATLEDGRAVTTLSTDLASPARWSAETPNLYTVTLELRGPDGAVREALLEKVGVREIETTRGQRGAQLLVNGQPTTVRGTNRHELDPDHGTAVPTETIVTDIERLKEFNLNAVRCSHYPNRPTFYRLADEYGLYVQDEVNAETHWWENLAAETDAYHEQFLARFRRMVLRDRNHASIFSWSTGNEAGTGAEHIAMAALCLADDDHLPASVNGDRFEGEPLGVDPTRPLYHQPNGGGWTIAYGDMLGPRYPDVAALRAEGDGTGVGEGLRPVVMGEYNHAMGNSLGLVDDMWGEHIQPPVRRARDRSDEGRAGVLVGDPTVEHVDGDAAVTLGPDDRIDVLDVPTFNLASGVTIGLTLHDWEGARTLLDAGGVEIALADGAVTLSIGDGAGSVTAPIADEAPVDALAMIDGDTIRLDVGGEAVSDTHAVDVLEIGDGMRIGASFGGGSGAAVTLEAVRILAEADGSAAVRSTGTPPASAVLWYDFADLLTDQALAGGFIWDWANQDLNATREVDGETVAYQDYDDDPFCLNGLVWSDRTPTPALSQLKYNHQPVGIAPADVAAGELYVTNHHGFRGLEEFDVRWTVTAEDESVQSGTLDLDVPPGETRRVAVPLEVPADPEPGVEYWLGVSVRLADDRAYADAGHEIAAEQLSIPVESDDPEALDAESVPPVSVEAGGDGIVVSGEGFEYTLDRETGTFSSLVYDGRELIDSGPVFDAWRVPIMNESQSWGGEQASSWYEAGLDRLTQRVGDVSVRRDGTTATIDVEATVEGADLGTQRRTVDPANGVSATVSGDPAVVEGIDGRALSMSGESFVGLERPSIPSLADGLTLECWVRPVDDERGPQPYILAGGQYTLKRRSDARGGGLAFSVYSDGFRVVTAPVPDDWTDGWHHLAGVWDPTADELQLYVDGEVLARTEFGGDLGSFDGRLRVGRDREHFLAEGTLLDDVRVHARALDAVGGREDPDDPFAWLPFETVETVSPDRPAFAVKYRYRVYGSGDVAIGVQAVPNDTLVRTIDDYLPRVGLTMALPDAFDRFEWYGRGPGETYPDRKSATSVGRHAGSAMDQFVPYLPPTDNGNKADTRWATLSDGTAGLLASFLGDSRHVKLSQWTNLDDADHHYQLETDGSIGLHLDHAVSGVGGTPVQLDDAYQVKPEPVTFGVRLRPYDDADPADLARTPLPFDPSAVEAED